MSITRPRPPRSSTTSRARTGTCPPPASSIPASSEDPHREEPDPEVQRHRNGGEREQREALTDLALDGADSACVVWSGRCGPCGVHRAPPPCIPGASVPAWYAPPCPAS